jgi:mono/diheme cytochrome c family protein
MKYFALLLAVAAACSSAGPRLPRTARGEPVLEVRGALEKGAHVLGRADLDALPRHAVRGVDPASGREATWEGVPVATLVSERVDLAKGADTVVVRSADGAAIPIPLTVIRTLKPVLADRADGARLPAPVLAWPSLEQRGLATDPRAVGWWTHGVVAFELVEWQRAFAEALATPDGAPDAARRGSGWFTERCVSCHLMRGAGGARGPDLTTVAARLRPGPFAALLQDHPGWTGVPGDPPGPEGAEELWSFLRAVAEQSSGGRTDVLKAETAPSPPNAP